MHVLDDVQAAFDHEKKENDQARKQHPDGSLGQNGQTEGGVKKKPYRFSTGCVGKSTVKKGQRERDEKCQGDVVHHDPGKDDKFHAGRQYHATQKPNRGTEHAPSEEIGDQHACGTENGRRQPGGKFGETEYKE